jgi:hypothetical protein
MAEKNRTGRKVTKKVTKGTKASKDNELLQLSEGQLSTEASATSIESENEEDFPEDWEDYYERGILDEGGKSVSYTVESKREDTRGRLAIIYTVATFIMFLLGFLVAIVDALLGHKSIVDGLSTILPLISGIFLGSLGFVLGYYFRKSEGEED